MKQPCPHRNDAPPMFENMPVLADEALWDLLELLTGLINAYESHYAVELERLRAHRRHKLITERDRQQLLPSLSEFDDDLY